MVRLTENTRPCLHKLPEPDQNENLLLGGPGQSKSKPNNFLMSSGLRLGSGDACHGGSEMWRRLRLGAWVAACQSASHLRCMGQQRSYETLLRKSLELRMLLPLIYVTAYIWILMVLEVSHFDCGASNHYSTYQYPSTGSKDWAAIASAYVQLGIFRAEYCFLSTTLSPIYICREGYIRFPYMLVEYVGLWNRIQMTSSTTNQIINSKYELHSIIMHYVRRRKLKR